MSSSLSSSSRISSLVGSTVGICSQRKELLKRETGLEKLTRSQGRSWPGSNKSGESGGGAKGASPLWCVCVEVEMGKWRWENVDGGTLKEGVTVEGWDQLSD